MKAGRFQIRIIILGGFVLILSASMFGAPEIDAASLQVWVGNTVITKEVKSVQNLKYEKVVRQTTDYSCGAASLATLLTYYFGRETTEEEILTTVLQGSEETIQRIKEKGISLLDLKKYAESLGFEGKGYRLTISDLRDLDRPAIVLINANGYNHFVVVKVVVEDKIHLADPVKGNMVMRLDEFEDIWNGILLAFRQANGETIQSHALCAKRVLPDDKLRLFPRLTDVATFATSPADF